MNALDPQLQQMALKLARGFVRKLPCNVQREDIEQAALIGLMKGLRKHPTPTGDREGWERYLRMRIRGAIIDELRAQDWATRRQRRIEEKPRPRVVGLEDVSPAWDEYFAGTADNPELMAIERLDAAKAYRAPINPTDLRILRARYEGGIKQKEVAVGERMSEPRISQRELRGLLGMRSYLTGEADPSLQLGTRQALLKERYR